MTLSENNFGRRVRELLEQRRLTMAEVAERAELAPSLVSKLLTETEAARREPRLEHVLAIARALELAPRELVVGTSAEALLGEWVPRREMEEESKARGQAQAEAAQLRTDLAGARSEANTLRSMNDQLSQDLAAATRRASEQEATTRRVRVVLSATEAKLAANITERDSALQQAQQNYEAWANARSRVLQLQREVADAKGERWIAALVGGVVGATLGSSAQKPSKKRRARS